MPSPTQKPASVKKSQAELPKNRLRLPLYFGWEIDLLRIKDLREHIIGPFKTYRGYFVTVVLIILVVSTTLFFRQNIKTLAATYNWIQTDWSGGASATTAANPGDRLNWTKYATKDSSVNTGTELSLSLSTNTTTQTSATDFGAGTYSTTVVSGSGDTASVKLDATQYNFSWTNATPGYGLAFSSTGDVTNLPHDIAISGTYAFVTQSSYLNVVDISDPTSLASLQQLNTGMSSIRNAAIYSHYVLVADSTTIKVYDFTNPAALSLTATMTSSILPTAVRSILVDGNYLYVGGSDFRVIDISTIASPSLKSTVTTNFDYYGTPSYIMGKMAKSGNYVFVAHSWEACDYEGCFAGGGIQSINVTTPTAAAQASYLDIGPRTGVAINGNYAYSLGSSELIDSSYTRDAFITNISNPNSLSSAGSFQFQPSPQQQTLSSTIITDNGYLYFTYFSGSPEQWGLKVYSLTNPTSPSLEGTLSKVNGELYGIEALGLAVSGNYVYLGAYRNISTVWQHSLLAVSQRGYASSGTFTSSIIDTTANQTFTNIDWTASIPTNTTLSIKARSSNAADMTGATDWASCSALADGADITGGCVTDAHRYIQYQAALGSSDATVSPTLSDLSIGSTRYAASATLTSSAYDAGDPTNVVGGIQWSATKPSGTDVKFQIRTAPDSNGAPGTWTDWLGPTSNSDYYVDSTGSESPNPSHADGVSDQWMQYKAYLESSSGSATPSVSDITLVYVVNAAPNFLSAPTAEQQADGAVEISYTIRDADTTTGQPANRGYITPSFEFSIDDGATWTAITTGLATGATDRKAVQESDYTTYLTSWTAKSQIDGIFAPNARIRVTINDGEGANNTASSPSAAFALDVKDPVLGSPAISIAATSSPAILTLAASDDNLLQMQVSLNSDFNGSNWETYAAAPTISLATDPDIVYVRFRDSFGNTTASRSATTAETPLYPIIRDVSNTLEPNYQLFVSWKTLTLPSAGFGAYYVWRSTDDGANYTLVRTITDRTLNYYLDSNLDTNTSYLYKISSVDGASNGSRFSGEVSDTPDGQGGTDETPPTISHVTIGSISTQSATITWDTDELSNSVARYSTTPRSFATGVVVASMMNNAAGVGQHTITLTGLEPATTYYVQVESEDPENNTDTDNDGGDGYTFTTLAGPSISNVSASQIQNTQATITWLTDTEANSSVVYSIYSDLSNPQTQINVGESTTSHSVTLTGLTRGTTYYYYVASGVANDTNGGDYYSLTTTLDSVAPVITSVTANPVTDTQALITWLTNESADSRVWYGVGSGSYASSTDQESNYNTSHARSLSSLTAATKYYYRVVSADAAGNTATSSESFFTTQSALSTEEQVAAREEIAREAGRASATNSGGGGGGGGSADTQAPIVKDIVVKDVTSDSARVTWTTDERANSFVQFGRSENYGELHGAWEYRIEHSVVLDHLTPNVPYHFRVAAADMAGNVRTSADATFSTENGSTIDTKVTEGETVIEPKSESAIITAVQNAAETVGELAASVSIQVLETTLSLQHDLIDRFSSSIPGPLISGEPQVSLTATTAEVSWGTDKESNSLIAFASADEYQAGTAEPYLSEVGDAEVRTLKHKVLLTGLTPDTLYHYQIRTKTPVSAMVKSSDFTFRTLRKSLEITNYTIEKVSDSEVILRWASNSDASSEIRITPYRNSLRSPEEARVITDEGFTSIHQLEAKDLEAGTLYDIDIISKDISGTEASKTIYAFSTNSENTPPLITQIKTESALSPGKDPKVQSIISWVTNEASTSRVYYQEGIGTSLDESQIATPLDQSFTRKHVIVLTSFKPGTVYRFRVESTDSSGLTTISSIHTILTPRQIESVFQIIVKNVESTFGWVRQLR